MRRRIPLIIVFVLIILASTSAQAKSNPPGQSPPSDVSLPTVTGVNAATQPLNGNSGTWSGPAPTYAYQWSRCNASGANCVSIAGATATIYMVASSDVGSTIRLVVVATNKNGATVAVSNPTPAITSLSQPATTSTSQSSTTSTTTTPTTTSTPTQTTPTTTTVATSTTVPTTTTFFTTTSTTSTTTTTAPAGNLFWSAGIENGNLNAFGVHTGMPAWGNSSAAVVQQGSLVGGLNHDGPWVAPAPDSGKYAIAQLVDGPATDVGSAGGQRAELSSSNYELPGTERWYGISVYIPSDPNKDANGGVTAYNNAIWEIGWGTSLMLKTSEDGSSSGDSNSFQIANGAATSPQKNGWSSAYYHLSPIVFDQWVHFTIHVYWAIDSTGYFEVYENGKLMTLTGLSNPSFSSTRVNGPNYGVPDQMYSEFDWYRGPLNVPSLLYLDNLKIGDTYNVVQPG